MTIELMNPPGLPQPEVYRQLSVATGSRLVFVAGQVARNAEGEPIGTGDLAAQVEQVQVGPRVDVVGELRIPREQRGRGLCELLTRLESAGDHPVQRSDEDQREGRDDDAEQCPVEEPAPPTPELGVRDEGSRHGF